MELNLPADLSEEKAIAWNEKIAVADGVKIHSGGYVEFADPAKHALKQYLPHIADGFHADEINKITRSMLELRARLTGEKAQSHTPDAQKVEASQESLS
jgi:hypothetical protein